MGVYLLSDRCLKFDVMSAMLAFYSACNCVFMSGSGVDEIALLTLQVSYSLPVLLYVLPALTILLQCFDTVGWVT